MPEYLKNALFLIIWNFFWLNLSDERFKMVPWFAKMKHFISSFWIKSLFLLSEPTQRLGLLDSFNTLLVENTKFRKEKFWCYSSPKGCMRSRVQRILTGVYPWVLGILTTVHACAQCIINIIFSRLLSLAGVGHIRALIVSYPCDGKPGLENCTLQQFW